MIKSLGNDKDIFTLVDVALNPDILAYNYNHKRQYLLITFGKTNSFFKTKENKRNDPRLRWSHRSSLSINLLETERCLIAIVFDFVSKNQYK